MAERRPAGAPASPRDDGADPGPALAALRARGAHRSDPIRFRFIEALARRAAVHAGPVRHLLDGKLARLLAAYHTQHEQASAEASATLARLAGAHPDTAAALDRLAASGDFKALHRLAASLDGQHRGGSALAELVRRLDQQAAQGSTPGSAADAVVAPAGPPTELKALRQFRSTWSKLSLDRQLQQSGSKVPENAGPLNSQRLVLRSLQRMRDISPQYLDRFMAYGDALLWLEQAASSSPAPQAKAAPGDGDRQRRSGRGKSG